MDRLFQWVIRRRRIVLLSWLVITAIGLIVAPSVSGRLQSGNQVNSAGYTANKQLLRQFGSAAADPSLLIIDLPKGTSVDGAAVDTALQRVGAAIPAASAVRQLSYANSHSPALVGSNGASTIVLTYPPKHGAVDPAVMELMSKAATAALPGASVHTTGLEQLSAGGSSQGSSVLLETVIGGLAALVILAWVFGSFLAFVPLFTALVSILTMQLAVLGLTYTTSMPFNPAVQFIVVILGLGLSIDYALLMVTRWREERATGLDNAAAVDRACSHAGRAVAVSGFTASVGLFALAVVPVSLIRGIGIAGLFIPSIASLVSLTLLPALLRSAGPRLDWPRRRTRHRADDRWLAWARLVVEHRWAAATVGVVLLGTLTGFAAQLTVAQPNPRSLAASGPASQGLAALHRDGFGDGTLTPMAVLVPPGQRPLEVAHQLAAITGIRGSVVATGAQWQSNDGSGLVLLLPTRETNAPGAGTVLAAVQHAAPSPDSVGGDQVLQADVTRITYQWFPAMLALVALVTFLFLARALRSLVLPAKAVVLNLLSVAATYGVVVMVWQEGIGARTIWGLSSTGSIESVIPILLFGFLFGLSMDYEVFILTRMREEFDVSGDTTSAIVQGIGRTGRLVTSAALIIFCALLSLSSAPDPTVKVLATGLAAGILIDATVVRSLLAPAIVSLLGSANWWLPAVAARFLRIQPSPGRPESPQVARRAGSDSGEPSDATLTGSRRN